METTVNAISSRELDRLCQQPWSAGEYSPLNGHPMVLLDLLTAKSPVTAEQHEQLAKILAQMACPIIAVAPADDRTRLTDAADVVVSSYREARSLAANIQQHPIAAMTLVQLLRHNDKSSLEDGLLAESFAYATLQGGKEFRHFLATRPMPPSPAENPEPAVVVEREDDQLILTLNRPEQHNAYSIAVRDALFEALALQANDHSITKTVIRGAGACFCTGGALHEFGLTDDTSSAHAIRCTRHVGKLIAALSEKVECHVHRACIGSGIELPAFAGRIVAKQNTFFHLPEITMGLIPGAGGTVSILRRIGRQRMGYLALSGKKINAATALTWGLIDEIET